MRSEGIFCKGPKNRTTVSSTQKCTSPFPLLSGKEEGVTYTGSGENYRRRNDSGGVLGPVVRDTETEETRGTLKRTRGPGALERPRTNKVRLSPVLCCLTPGSVRLSGTG